MTVLAEQTQFGINKELELRKRVNTGTRTNHRKVVAPLTERKLEEKKIEIFDTSIVEQ